MFVRLLVLVFDVRLALTFDICLVLEVRRHWLSWCSTCSTCTSTLFDACVGPLVLVDVGVASSFNVGVHIWIFRDPEVDKNHNFRSIGSSEIPQIDQGISRCCFSPSRGN